MYELFLKIVDLVHFFGYLGVFIMVAIESTFIPIPSEVTLIPAGFLASTGDMNFFILLVVSIAGTICGSLINYYIALKFGRALLTKFGKYFFMSNEQLIKIENFFTNHGAISVFSGRLLPGVKHFISFPAGLARMNLKTFCIYTALGGAIWSLLLLSLGYIIGTNADLIAKYVKQINFILFVTLVCIIIFYIWYNKLRNK